ncbi:helix-turn-helix domain-containing protein [uncultured Agrococcus sp.]|uniref:TetR/AcrR family transcriptional regulator n=1 Tax=uncultured Agrococcus sp. TaxID=382258 RepID=UPI0025E1B4AC|nr:helix-turn-helix domain-containing protein [uncultured Agrococcus sp.]
MTRRGPRGDIDRERILRAADRLLHERGSIEGVALRAVAGEVGVATNALYTYFPSLRAIWHELGDERLGTLLPRELLGIPCRHCAVLELMQRANTMANIPGTLSLLRAQPILGRHSFALSETIMELTADATVHPRDAHDLIVGWFYGNNVLTDEGWTSGTDAIRAEDDLTDFPRIASRPEPRTDVQLGAILTGIGLPCTADRE